MMSGQALLIIIAAALFLWGLDIFFINLAKAKKSSCLNKNYGYGAAVSNKTALILHTFLVSGLIAMLFNMGWGAKLLAVSVLFATGIFFTRRYILKLGRFKGLTMQKKADAAAILILEFCIALFFLLSKEKYDLFWGLKMGFTLMFLVYLPFSKHLHIILSPFYILIYGTKRTLKQPLLNLEDKKLGAEYINELQKIDVFGAFSCSECGRCSAVCPAQADPRLMMMEIRRAAKTKQPIGFTSAALYHCTGCGACFEACPIGINPLSAILQIRQHRTLELGQLPKSLAKAGDNICRSGNSWSIKTEEEKAGKPVGILLFWGEKARLDKSYAGAKAALENALKKAGVDYFTLGSRETNLAENQRKLGNEALWQRQRKEFLNLLGELKPDVIVTPSPHIYHTLKFEYGLEGVEVLHHSELLLKLLREGKLYLKNDVPEYYFEPCYIGRICGEHNTIKGLASQFPAVKKLDKVCCGGPSAEFFRERETFFDGFKLCENHPKVITFCPHCPTMLGADKCRDISELVY